MDCWTFARKVMRFLEVGPRCPPEAWHGQQPCFLIPEDPRNIAAENPPVFFVSEMLFRERNCPLRMPELYPSPDGSELCLCPTTGGLSDKNARSARRAVFSQVEPQIFHRMIRQRKHNPQPQTPSYKYSFRLNEEQDLRFRQMLAAAGLEHNRSQFIVKRLFAERFEVIRRDPSKVEFLTRLNDLYFQFQRVGNNYNQVVKAINSHFSNVSIPRQIAALEQHTRELKALSIEILNLTKQAEGWLRI